MEHNDPQAVAEVTALFLAYEAALVGRDLDAMALAFDDSPDLVRFGINDEQRGPEALARWREAQAPLPPGRTRFETVVSTFGRDVAVVSTCFRYPERQFVGRQSQMWVRVDGTWKIVHAHVSELPEDLDASDVV
jgi:ketosteroid isomerase-like protein